MSREQLEKTERSLNRQYLHRLSREGMGMNVYYVTFRSVTPAQRGENLLRKQGFRCILQRTPRWMEEQGCGYALRVWTKDILPAVNLLQRNQLPLRRVYLQQGDGQLEELRL